MQREPSEFDDILHQCITAMRDNGEDLETCLARHPKYRDELLPLLILVDRLRSARSMQVSPTFRSAANTRLQRLLARKSPPRLAPARQWRYLAAVMVVVLALMSGGGLLAREALPGDDLYPIRRQFEQVRYTLAPTRPAAARLSLLFATRRVDDALILSGRDRVTDVTLALDEYRWLVDDAFRVIQQPEISPSDQAAFLDIFATTRADTTTHLGQIGTRHRDIAALVDDTVRYTQDVDRPLKEALEAADATEQTPAAQPPRTPEGAVTPTSAPPATPVAIPSLDVPASKRPTATPTPQQTDPGGTNPVPSREGQYTTPTPPKEETPTSTTGP